MLQIWRICAKITCGLLTADQNQQKSNFGFIRYVKYAVRCQLFVDKAGDFCIYYRSIDGSFECPSGVEAIGGVSWYYLPLIVEPDQGFRGIHKLTRRKPKENHYHLRGCRKSLANKTEEIVWGFVGCTRLIKSRRNSLQCSWTSRSEMAPDTPAREPEMQDTPPCRCPKNGYTLRTLRFQFYNLGVDTARRFAYTRSEDIFFVNVSAC